MEKKTKRTMYEEKEVSFKLFHPADIEVDFIPWGKGEKNKQSLIKLRKEGKTAYLYFGDETLKEVESQKMLMKLLTAGWEKMGEVSIEFDGRSGQEKEADELFSRDVVRIEIGRNLLPLVDPATGAPLVDAVGALRKDIAAFTGFVLPGIHIRDNLMIPFDNYVIFLKETPIASGEIFLDRFLAIGSSEQLSQLKGWSVKDPVFSAPAQWIETNEKAKAEELGCMVMGPLNVMITHLRNTIEVNLKDILGLQDVKRLLEHLQDTHPIVVEDFLKDKKKLRQIRKILQNLLSERVGIRDLVSILETIGDNEEIIEKTDLITELVRILLARQICWSYVDVEGKINALVLSRRLEEKIQSSLKETKQGLTLTLKADEADAIIAELKKTLQDYGNPQVIFCDPQTRIYFRRLTAINFPNLGILSTAEISRNIPVHILGEVELPGSVPIIPAKSEDEREENKKDRGLLSKYLPKMLF